MAEWVTIAQIAELPEGRGVVAETLGHRIALFRVGDDVYAIGDRCSHAEASLAEGEVFEGEVECPRHGAVFEMSTGKAITLPATRPVPTYEVKIEGGAVSLLLEKVEES